MLQFIQPSYVGSFTGRVGVVCAEIAMEELTASVGDVGDSCICKVPGVFEELPPQLVRTQQRNTPGITFRANVLFMFFLPSQLLA
jgi:hypothetical protein